MYADRYPGEGKNTSFAYSSVAGIVAAVISFLIGGAKFEFNYITLILGCINALTFFVYYLALYNSSKEGPYSIVMVFSIAGGISIPVLTSMIAFGEVPSLLKVLCFIVIFISCYFVSKREDEKTEIKNKKKFFVYTFLLAFVNGAYGGLINLQQGYTGESQKDEMLIYTFLFSAIISFVFILLKNEKKPFSVYKQTKGSLIFMIAAALTAALAVNMLVLIAAYIDVNLLWTFNNSGVLVFSVIASAIFFKEKMSVKNIIGCIVIAAALVAVSFC
jgi:drug/metabolite transporter (DMT)-like permease